MKNSLLILFLIGLNTYLFSQKEYLKNYYEEGFIKEEGWIDSGNKVGFWIFYYKNGNKKKEGHFKNNIPVKYWYFYNQNSSIEKEGHYSEGKQNKWWLFYDENGIITHKCQLKDDQKNGYCLLYKNDQLIKALRFSNDKKINEWTDFSSFKKENNLTDLR